MVYWYMCVYISYVDITIKANMVIMIPVLSVTFD